MRNIQFKSIWNDVLLISLPFLVLGIMAGFIHLPVLFVFFFLLFFRMNKVEMSIVILLVFPRLLGLILLLLGYRVPGSIVSIILVFLLLRLNLLKVAVREREALLFTSLIVGIFFVFYLFTGKTSFSDKKIFDLLVTSVLSFFAFSLLSSSFAVDLKLIGRFFYVYSLILISIGVDILHIFHLSGIFDFSSIRNNYIETFHAADTSLILSYHPIGIAGLTGLAFMLSVKKLNKLDYLMILAFLWLILMSGARQALVGGFIIILLKPFINNRHFNLLSISKWIIAIVLFSIVLYVINIDFISSIFDQRYSSNERLNRNYDYPIKIMKQQYMEGVGFGNYFNPKTGEIYPHNILLEIICEMGIFGLVILSLVVFFFAIRNKISIRHQLKCKSYAFMIFVPYIVRSLISDSLGHNIIVFVILFVLYSNNDRRKVQWIIRQIRRLFPPQKKMAYQ